MIEKIKDNLITIIGILLIIISISVVMYDNYKDNQKVLENVELVENFFEIENNPVEEQKEEAVMLALRTSTGLDLEAYKAEFGENFLAKKKDKIAMLIKNEFIKLTPDNHIVCTNKGFLVLNQIVLELVS